MRRPSYVTIFEALKDVQAMALIGEFNDWNPEDAHWAVRNEFGVWELFLPDQADGTSALRHKYALVFCRPNFLESL